MTKRLPKPANRSRSVRPCCVPRSSPPKPKTTPAVASTSKASCLDLLLDTGSFEEIGRFRGGDINGGRAGSAVITGFGEVFGRKVAVYAQDFSVKGGTLGVAEGRKICHLMDKALDLKVPIIALIDSGGARIQEGVAALTEYGHLFR